MARAVTATVDCEGCGIETVVGLLQPPFFCVVIPITRGSFLLSLSETADSDPQTLKQDWLFCLDLPMPTTVNSLYHRTEAHFFSATCPLHRSFNACVSAYFADEVVNEWNLLFVRVGSEPLGVGMAACEQLIRSVVLPVRIVIHQEKVEELAQSLQAMGFIFVQKTSAMVLDLKSFTAAVRTPVSDTISLTQSLDDWAAPLGSAFGLTAEGVARYQARHQVAIDRGEGFYHFALSVEGRPVSAITLSMCDGLARLNDMGTHIEFRGRGYATRLIQVALAHAVSLGVQTCFLEASNDGFLLYRSFGFQALFDYQAFVRGPLVNGR